MIVHNLFVRDVYMYKDKWLCRVKTIVDNCSLSYLWLNPSMIDTNQAKQLMHTRIEEVALHNWYTYISTSSMCTIFCYRNNLFNKKISKKYIYMNMYTHTYTQENYIIKYTLIHNLYNIQ